MPSTHQDLRASNMAATFITSLQNQTDPVPIETEATTDAFYGKNEIHGIDVT